MRSFKQNGTFSGRLHLIASRPLGTVQRLVSAFERQVTAFTRLKLRHAHGYRDGHRLALEVKRAGFDGGAQGFTYGQGIGQ